MLQLISAAREQTYLLPAGIHRTGLYHANRDDSLVLYEALPIRIKSGAEPFTRQNKPIIRYRLACNLFCIAYYLEEQSDCTTAFFFYCSSSLQSS